MNDPLFTTRGYWLAFLQDGRLQAIELLHGLRRHKIRRWFGLLYVTALMLLAMAALL
ncbi:MAG TPA: hypothetical protein VF194_16690 [Ferrovibrio sp.]|jgi:hypothetical protein|uniref:hypothetical protein n=1 Tax=Ferrovibrio sp. TaxID=1917215 RepID=UPI002ED5BD48